MKQNIKIAKELLKLAKELSADNVDGGNPDIDWYHDMNVYKNMLPKFYEAFEKYLTLREMIINSIKLRHVNSTEANVRLQNLYNQIDEFIKNNGDINNKYVQQLKDKQMTVQKLIDEFFKSFQNATMDYETSYDEFDPQTNDFKQKPVFRPENEQHQYALNFNSQISQLIKATDDIFYITNDVKNRSRSYIKSSVSRFIGIIGNLIQDNNRQNSTIKRDEDIKMTEQLQQMLDFLHTHGYELAVNYGKQRGRTNDTDLIDDKLLNNNAGRPALELTTSYREMIKFIASLSAEERKKQEITKRNIHLKIIKTAGQTEKLIKDDVALMARINKSIILNITDLITILNQESSDQVKKNREKNKPSIDIDKPMPQNHSLAITDAVVIDFDEKAINNFLNEQTSIAAKFTQDKLQDDFYKVKLNNKQIDKNKLPETYKKHIVDHIQDTYRRKYYNEQTMLISDFMNELKKDTSQLESIFKELNKKPFNEQSLQKLIAENVNLQNIYDKLHQWSKARIIFSLNEIKKEYQTTSVIKISKIKKANVINAGLWDTIKQGWQNVVNYVINFANKIFEKTKNIYDNFINKLNENTIKQKIIELNHLSNENKKIQADDQELLKKINELDKKLINVFNSLKK